MKLDKELLEILRDPADPSVPLKEADSSVVERLNELIKEGQLKDAKGKTVDFQIDGLLVTPDGKKGYLIREGIPVLLVDRAVDLQSITD